MRVSFQESGACGSNAATTDWPPNAEAKGTERDWKGDDKGRA